MEREYEKNGVEFILEKIDNIILPFQRNHPRIFMVAVFLVAILAIILFIPAFILYTLFYFLHNVFFTVMIYRKTNDKPERYWL